LGILSVFRNNLPASAFSRDLTFESDHPGIEWSAWLSVDHEAEFVEKPVVEKISDRFD
jgi:hypothetical protein